MARLRKTRGGVVYDPFSSRVERAACFDVSNFERTLMSEVWSETDAGRRDLLRRIDQRIPGFVTQFAPEVIHRLFADPVREIPADRRGVGASLRAQLHAALDGAQAFIKARDFAHGNALRTRIVADNVLTWLASSLESQGTCAPDAERARQAAEGVEQALGKDSPHAQKARDAAEQAQQAQDGAHVKGDHLTNNANEGARQGEASADRQGARGAGRGTDANGWAAGTDHDAGQLAQQVRNYPEVREVAKLAGRLLPTLTRLSDERKTAEAQERNSITVSRELSRLVPRELIDLGGMRGQVIAAGAFRRMTDGGALAFGREGKDNVGHGPIVVVVDQSGSMGGMSDRWAKAVTLALAIHARREHRAFGVITYGTNVRQRHAWKRGAVARDLVGVLSSSPSGGTNWGSPLHEALRLIHGARASGFKLADIVHITDGLPSDPDAYASFRCEAQKARVRTWGVAVGHDAQSIAGDDTSFLARWSDAVCAVTDANEDGKALTLMAKAL